LHVITTIRPLTTLEDCRRVAALEREVWGYTDAEDVVPPPVLLVSIRRGGILLGAFDAANEMKGFVYSIPALKDGRPAQWSHMLGVTKDARQSGLGARLKLAQRDHALRMGLDLIEWTYDPLQALNAHLNFAKLGVVVSEYEENIYGESSSPLHRGSPTDRFVAEWHIAEPHVVRRLESWGQAVIRDGSVAAAPIVNRAHAGVVWIRPGGADLAADARRLLVEIPTGFSDMQLGDPDLALAWRLHTREIFQAYFGRGYRAVDFFLSPQAGRGQYLLTAGEDRQTKDEA
jgi:predicted GNAT superfamily acetyltransferase